VDVVLMAGRYTLLDQSGSSLLALAQERGVRVVLGGVFNSGLLANPHGSATFNYFPAPGSLVQRAQELETICSSYGVPLRAAALQFCDRHPAASSLLVGMRSAAEVEDATAVLSLDIPAELWAELA
jgi:D-threo-aldose 1-dehydrogenase